MRRRIGTVILGASVAALALALPAGAREGLEGYVGSKLCNACHKSTNAEVVAGAAKTSHVFTFWAIADQGGERKVVGDFSANPGFKQADVAYVLGRGAMRGQAYIGSDFKVLPAEWNVQHKMWMPIPADDAKKSCIACHTTGYDATKGEYSEAGVTCEACHGPGANHAKSASTEKKATATNPKNMPPDRRAMICGRCHARGKNPDGLPFAVGYNPGDDLTKYFKLDDTWDQGTRNSQYNDLASGKHLAKGVACDTCHDPHGVAAGQPHQLRKASDDLCLDCHKPPIPGDQHSTPKDCVRCHMLNGSHQFEKPKIVAPGTPHWH